MKLYWRTLFALLALIAGLTASIAQASEPGDVILQVPFRSQLDGTVWGASNCGPTAISMVLAAFGQVVPTKTLRDRANQLLGIADPATGTRIQDLARVVSERGLSVNGPYDDGKRFRRWTLDEVRQQVRQGRPVVPQVYYPLLPNHRKNPVNTDHYIVIVGLSGDDFVFNDSADRYEPGYRQEMTAAEFSRAWGASKFPFAAFSADTGATGKSLLPLPADKVQAGSRDGRSDGSGKPLLPLPGTADKLPLPPAQPAPEPDAIPNLEAEAVAPPAPAGIPVQAEAPEADQTGDNAASITAGASSPELETTGEPSWLAQLVASIGQVLGVARPLP